MKQWLSGHPDVVVILIVCATAVFIAALILGAPLGWVPQFLRDLLGL
jgi:hypothetical protein